MNKFHFFFLLIEITIEIEKKIVILPITKYITKTNLNTPEEIIKDLLDNSYLSINLEIGSPIQKIPLYLNFEKYPISLAGPNINVNIKYDNTISKSSYVNESNHFDYNGEKFKRGRLSYDNINLINYDLKNKNNLGKNFEVEKLNFVLTTEQKGKESGILGLSVEEIYPGNNLKNYNFINQLKKKDIISSYIFTIKFFEDKEEGQLIIGDYPHNYDKKNYDENNYKYFYARERSNIVRWDIVFDNIYSSNEIINKDPHTALFIESGIIQSFYEYKNIIDKQFFNDKIGKSCFMGKYTILETFYYYYCKKDVDLSNFPNLNFEIKSFDYNMTLTYKELFKLVNDKYIFLVLIPDSVSYSYWILGEPFFRKNQLIFNTDNKVIGFYKGKGNKKSGSFSLIHNRTFWIFMVILAFGVIIYLVRYIYLFYHKKVKRQLAKELIEDCSNDGYNKLGV